MTTIYTGSRSEGVVATNDILAHEGDDEKSPRGKLPHPLGVLVTEIPEAHASTWTERPVAT